MEIQGQIISLLIFFCLINESTEIFDETKTTTTSSDCADFPWKINRLPKWIEPYHYTLRLQPNVTTNAFTGSVNIEINVIERTDLIVFHSDRLNISDVNIYHNSSNVDIQHVVFCPDRGQIAISLKEKLPLNSTYTIYLNFSGEFSNQEDGLYKSAYVNSKGKQKYLSLTTFEPTSARSVFPCWDEPTFKAEFTVKIIRDPDMFSLSNMDLEKKKHLPSGLVEDTFQKSMKMSTYLVALVVCDYARISDISRNDVNVSVYAPHSQIKLAKFALDTSVSGMDFFENFFKVKYSMEKFDQVSVNDFPQGAMENWGLVTFTDFNVLYDSDKPNVDSEETVAETVIHELAHQWFGDLVTMKWWNDLWLNEAFAQFFQWYANSHINKDWNLMDKFVADYTAPSMQQDGLVNTHPISVEVEDTAEISSLFDDITYDKGAAVLRMVMATVGPEAMRNGISDYLFTFKYSNADANDFWNSISKHSGSLQGLDVMDFATNFTDQPGYPMVSVMIKDGRLFANQTRFYYLREEMEKSRGKQLWHIPLTITTDNGTKLTRWMKREEGITFEMQAPTKWFKINHNSNGFYRVNYEDKNWKGLIKQLNDNHTVFSPSDRAGLLNDAFAFFRVGLMESETLFQMLTYLTKETSTAPWSITSKQLLLMEQNLEESSTYFAFRKFIKSVLKPTYKKCGWKVSTSHEAKFTQKEILTLACHFDVDDCRTQATKTFLDFLHNKTNISADHRIILCKNAIDTDAEIWDTVFKLYTDSNVPSVKLDYLQCLASTNNPWKLNRFLEMTLNSSIIRPHAVAIAVETVVSNLNGKFLFWRFFKRNYDDLTKQLPVVIVSELILTLKSFNTNFDLQELKHFFEKKHEDEFIQSTVEDTLELIRISIQFLQLNEYKIANFLSKNNFSL